MCTEDLVILLYLWPYIHDMLCMYATPKYCNIYKCGHLLITWCRVRKPSVRCSMLLDHSMHIAMHVVTQIWCAICMYVHTYMILLYYVPTWGTVEEKLGGEKKKKYWPRHACKLLVAWKPPGPRMHGPIGCPHIYTVMYIYTPIM
jgi:hypothetical protein